MMVDLPFYTDPGANVAMADHAPRLDSEKTCLSQIAEDHFVKRGVAILCQLDD
jgi:hypothetical protein